MSERPLDLILVIPSCIIVGYLLWNLPLAFGKAKAKEVFREIKKPQSIECPTCGQTVSLFRGKYNCFNCGKYIQYAKPTVLIEVKEKDH